MTDRTLFIGGEWSAGPATVEVIDPATGNPVGTTSVADRGAVEVAVAAARRGQVEWWGLGARGSAPRAARGRRTDR